MGLATPPGTKARDTVAVLEVTPEGAASNTVARVPHGLWEILTWEKASVLALIPRSTDSRSRSPCPRNRERCASQASSG